MLLHDAFERKAILPLPLILGWKEAGILGKLAPRCPLSSDMDSRICPQDWILAPRTGRRRESTRQNPNFPSNLHHSGCQCMEQEPQQLMGASPGWDRRQKLGSGAESKDMKTRGMNSKRRQF